MYRMVRTLALALPALLAVCAPARAHFLWAVVEPDGGSARALLRFSETPAEPTSPALLARVRPERAWAAGRGPLQLAPREGALACAMPAGARVLAAWQSWGVTDRAAQGRGVFLLRYHAKGAATIDDAGADAGLRVEVYAREVAGRCEVTVRDRGQAGGAAAPAAGAEIQVSAPGGGQAIALTADANGCASFAPGSPGLCGIRALVRRNVEGTHGGKPYALVRDYSTLTFRIGASARRADPAAWDLLRSAHANRYVLPTGFAGLSADVTLRDASGSHAGTLEYTKAGNVRLTMDGVAPEELDWVRSQLSNQLGHRRGGDFAVGDGRYPITFGPDEGAALLGRAVELNDGLRSTYRVRDRVVTEVTRTTGDTRFTITVLETRRLPDGRYLPRHFVVTYFDAGSGALKRVETYRDEFGPLLGVWVPLSRRVTVAEDGRVSAREIRLSRARLATPTRASAGP
ncbi:MAG: DUF3386 family protein [Chthonomonadales bacterium]|nr:DUF3386 family protein [Chthonomonadales bacterium]